MTINIQRYTDSSHITTNNKQQATIKKTESDPPTHHEANMPIISSPKDLLSRIQKLDIKESIINKTREEGSFKSCADWGNKGEFSKATL